MQPSHLSAPIAQALLDAHTRGIQVQVILDNSHRTAKYSSADFMAHQGVPTMIDVNHLTKSAQEKNAENLLIIRQPTLATRYTKNWEAHRQHSQPYVGRGVRQRLDLDNCVP